jgi:hypothetical protein
MRQMSALQRQRYRQRSQFSSDDDRIAELIDQATRLLDEIETLRARADAAEAEMARLKGKPASTRRAQSLNATEIYARRVIEAREFAPSEPPKSLNSGLPDAGDVYAARRAPNAT